MKLSSDIPDIFLCKAWLSQSIETCWWNHLRLILIDMEISLSLISIGISIRFLDLVFQVCNQRVSNENTLVQVVLVWLLNPLYLFYQLHILLAILHLLVLVHCELIEYICFCSYLTIAESIIYIRTSRN